MDNSPRRILPLNFDFSNLFFGSTHLPMFNLINNRKIINKKRKTMNMFNMEQMNSIQNEKLINIYNMLPKIWMDNVYDSKVNLEHYSPSLTRDLERAMEKSMRQIKYMKYPNTIIDMFNSQKRTRDINNMCNLLYSTINKDIVMPKNDTSDYLRQKFQKVTPRIIDEPSDKIEIMTEELVESMNMETSINKKPLVTQTLRRCNIISKNRNRDRGKIQLRNSGISQVKHKKERLKHNLYSNIRDDLDVWSENEQDFSDVNHEDCNTSTVSTDNYIQYDEIITAKYQKTDSDYPTLNQTFSIHQQTKYSRKIPKKNLDSPIQSPSDYVSVKCNFRSRLLSESSIDSDESCFIVFQDDTGSTSTDNDYETSSGEESEDDNNDDEQHEQSNRKVRFDLEPKIHEMITWNFAYRAARKGSWEEMARDRERFSHRIKCVDKVLSPILSLKYRELIYQNRFAVKLQCN